jgi:hypothetical protein
VELRTPKTSQPASVKSSLMKCNSSGFIFVLSALLNSKLGDKNRGPENVIAFF